MRLSLLTCSCACFLLVLPSCWLFKAKPGPVVYEDDAPVCDAPVASREEARLRSTRDLSAPVEITWTANLDSLWKQEPCNILELPALAAFRAIIPPLESADPPRNNRPIAGVGELNKLPAALGQEIPQFGEAMGSVDMLTELEDGSLSHHLEGLKIDALSIGHDWLRLDWVPGSGMNKWILATIGPTESPGWATLAFRDANAMGSYLYVLGWGHRLMESGILPEITPLSGHRKLDTSAPAVKLFQLKTRTPLQKIAGLDHNVWPVVANGGAGRKAESPITTEDLACPLTSFKVFFSIVGSGPSYDAMSGRMKDDPDQWRSGATIFSVEWTPDEETGGSWGEPQVEFSPWKEAPFQCFDEHDDIDALAIDAINGRVVASLDSDEGSEEPAFYAWSFRTIGLPDGAFSPSPLHNQDGVELGASMMVSGKAMHVSSNAFDHVQPRPAHSCGADPTSGRLIVGPGSQQGQQGR